MARADDSNDFLLVSLAGKSLRLFEKAVSIKLEHQLQLAEASRCALSLTYRVDQNV